MNALQTLLWVEWKKSGAKVSLLFGLFGIGSIILISKETMGIGLMVQSITLSLMYLAGMGILSLLSFQIGADFKSDRFHPLLLSPVSPWVHLSARTGFQAIIALIYYLLLSGLTAFVFEPFFTENVLQMTRTLIIINLYFVLAVILPGMIYMLFISMIGMSFGEAGKGRRLAVFLLTLASYTWLGKGFQAALRVGGQYLPVIEIKLPESLIRIGADEQIDLRSFWSIDRGGLLSFPDGSIPLYLEPLFMVFGICLLLIFLSTRIWEEVEI